MKGKNQSPFLLELFSDVVFLASAHLAIDKQSLEKLISTDLNHICDIQSPNGDLRIIRLLFMNKRREKQKQVPILNSFSDVVLLD